jgi:predicted CopG family antitoxin
MCRPGESYTDSMISIPITDEAYEALKARNPGIEQDQTSRGRNGQLRIWVDRTFLDQLLEVRRPGESYSDVILRVAEA